MRHQSINSVVTTQLYSIAIACMNTLSVFITNSLSSPLFHHQTGAPLRDAQNNRIESLRMYIHIRDGYMVKALADSCPIKIPATVSPNDRGNFMALLTRAMAVREVFHFIKNYRGLNYWTVEESLVFMSEADGYELFRRLLEDTANRILIEPNTTYPPGDGVWMWHTTIRCIIATPPQCPVLDHTIAMLCPPTHVKMISKLCQEYYNLRVVYN